MKRIGEIVVINNVKCIITPTGTIPYEEYLKRKSN